MKKLLVLFLLIFYIITFSFAQSSEINGVIKGSVVDSITGKSLALVNVIVTDRNNQEIKSVTSLEDGSFQLSNLAFKQYNLILVYLGYRRKTILLPDFSRLSPVIDLGKIHLAMDTKELKTVEISAARPIIKQEVDKVTYDVEADPESKTQMTIDVLRKVPFITVDGDDNVLLRGSKGYKVLVNGRTSSLFVQNPKDVFKSMPANTIKKIEVITNPPAKYDAEGIGGIINIITVRRSLAGFSGSVGLGATSPKGYNVTGYVTSKIKKIGFSTYYNNNFTSTPFTSNNLYREDFTSYKNKLSQTGKSNSESFSQNFGGDLSFEPDTLNLLSTYIGYYSGSSDNHLFQHVDYLREDNTPAQAYDRRNNSESNWSGVYWGFDYQKTAKRNKEQIFTASYKLTSGVTKSLSDFKLDPLLNYEAYQGNTNNDATSDEHTVQLDYVLPIKNFVIEAGAKSIFRINKSDYSLKAFNAESGTYIIDPAQSNVFDYYQDIYAAYTSVSFKKDKWGFKLGGRLEETSINANFKSTETKASPDYFNLIPSLAVSRNLSDASSTRLYYNKRIERPGLGYLNPYVNVSDPKNISYGNPYLKPALNNSVGIGYSAYLKVFSLNADLYYSFTDNSIQGFTLVREDTARTTYKNIGKNSTVGMAVSGRINITKNFSLDLNSNVYNASFTSSNNGKEQNNTGTTATLFSYWGYSFTKGWRTSTNIGFSTASIGLQGNSRGYFYNSLSVSKKLIKEKASLNFSISNPFQKNFRWTSEVNDPNFHQRQEAVVRMRKFSLSFNYGFGKWQGVVTKKKRGIKNDDIKTEVKEKVVMPRE